MRLDSIQSPPVQKKYDYQNIELLQQKGVTFREIVL